MFCMTILTHYQRHYADSVDDLYDLIYDHTGDHHQAEEMSSWAENAPYGDNWTWDDIDVEIIEDDD